MDKNDAILYFNDNFSTIESAYTHEYGSDTEMPNPRVEDVVTFQNTVEIIVSCHYDGYDDYDDDEIKEKDSWDFIVYIDGELPGGIRVV